MTLLASRHCDQKLHQLRIGQEQEPVGARRDSEISNTNEYGSNANAEVKMKRSLMATAALFALATFSSTADAARVRVGTLDCDISGGIRIDRDLEEGR
jgi:hypothetical protein